MVKFVYGILPAFVKYKDVDREVKNFASGCRITLESRFKCDNGILQHELTHVKQWYRNFMVFFYKRYNGDREFRLRCEIEAYIEQTKFPK